MSKHSNMLPGIRVIPEGMKGHNYALPRQTINAIENDKYDPTLLLAFKPANILGTTVDELFEPDPATLK